jgi:hypothetical protein
MDEMPGMSFGHAGTIVEGKEDTATEKIARLAEAGITVAERIEDIPEIVKEKIAERSRGVRKDGIFIAVEVDDGGRRRHRARAQADRGLPGRHLRPGRRRARDRREEPRRVRALPLCLDASPAGTGEDHQALRRRAPCWPERRPKPRARSGGREGLTPYPVGQ